MDGAKENEVGCEEAAEDDLFFIEDSSSSEGEINVSHRHYDMSCKQAARLRRESSPPLLLAFSVPSGRSVQDTSLSSSDDSQEDNEEDGDQPIEEWMILEEEEQVGDSSIQLNLSYGNSSEDDSGDEVTDTDSTDKNVKPLKDIWDVSEKDKYGADQSLTNRYFVPGHLMICHICNRTGHLAKSCYYQKQKCPTCVLCGIQGHIRRDCPGRPCSSCGLPFHGLRPCEMPPVWNQHCQRCGITGHLSDACPDTWRQYHLTIRLEVPLRPQIVPNLNHKRLNAHCYNCSKKGHYGYECTSRRMVSGTFPSVPYVCCYDTMHDILQRRAKKGVKEIKSARPPPPSDTEQLSEKTGESGEDKERSKTKQETWTTRAGRRKTWPERRRERREVKRLRRKAQAMREGSLLGRTRGDSDDEGRYADPLRHCLHKQYTPPPQKKKREETGARKSKKSREAERWKKRGGTKRGDLYPHGDVGIGNENLLSPRQRVRHRRR